MTQFITLIESKDFFQELEKHECPETVYQWFVELLRTGDTESIYDRKSIIHDE